VADPCKKRKIACPASPLFQCSLIRSDAADAAAASHKTTQRRRRPPVRRRTALFCTNDGASFLPIAHSIFCGRFFGWPNITTISASRLFFDGFSAKKKFGGVILMFSSVLRWIKVAQKPIFFIFSANRINTSANQQNVDNDGHHLPGDRSTLPHLWLGTHCYLLC